MIFYFFIFPDFILIIVFSTPAAGYYNNDDVPDFMVKYAHGPGFPIYYYSQVNATGALIRAEAARLHAS